MSWGTELWDQFDNIEKHTQWGIDFVERYSKFVKERLDIEQSYAKQLRNLYKKYFPKRSNKDEEPRFTACQAFFHVLSELNDYAGQREVVAEEIGHSVYGEIMRYTQDLKTERKAVSIPLSLNFFLFLVNSKRKFERECKETEKAQLGYERLDSDHNATKADVEKAKQQLHVRTHAADECKNEYAAQLQNFNNEQQKHFQFIMPQVFKNLQAMDERKTEKLAECYRYFAEAERRVIPIINKCLEGMIHAAKSVDERKDSQIVIESFKSGFEIPGDFPFEDFSQNIYRTVSDGSLSAQRNEIKADQKHTVGKSKGKLWLFGKKNKGSPLEDFSHLPPEQRRKKLQQRIDELNRELQKEIDQRDALNKMKDVYQRNPQMGDPGSLPPRITETMSNIDRLRQEVQKNEVIMETRDFYTDDANQEQKGHHRNPDPRQAPEFEDEFEDDEPLPAIGHCKSLYPFDGQNEGTLLMQEGEVMYVIEEDKGDGWTRIRKQNGEEGYVPTSYIDITLEKNSKGAVTYI
uniref:Formin-binding protein 1-like n=1 Tax=Callorhinchus milii TaxID=7868 RepID=A0A4W3HF44_CALMI